MVFKPGDRVRLNCVSNAPELRMDAGATGVVMSAGAGVLSVYWDKAPHHKAGGQYYAWRFDLETPVSPLEAAVRAYIRSELPNV